MGSRGDRQDSRLHFSWPRFARTVPDRRATGVPAASGHRTRIDRIDHPAELPRHPAECDLSELDIVRHARAVRHIRRIWRHQRLAAQLPTFIYALAIRFHIAGHADRALLHDRLRVGE